MVLREQIEGLLGPLLMEMGVELVELKVSRGKRGLRIQLAIDTRGGVSVDDCASVSKRISRRLDAEPLLVEGYTLEVSSPGMNRRIWSADHFQRFTGEKVRIELKEAMEGRARFTGRIEGIEGGIVRISLADGGHFECSLDAIREARVELDPWKKPGR